MDRDVIKAMVGLAASAGVGVIVRNAVKHTTPLNVSRTDKVLIGVGSLAISGILSNYTISYTNDQVDFVYKTVENIRLNRKRGQETVVIPEDPTDEN